MTDEAVTRARRCLGRCGRKVERGSWCEECKQGTGWGRGRSRQDQALFRALVLERDGYRCTYVENGARCPATADLRACHIKPLAHGGTHSLDNGTTRCGRHDRMTDAKAR